MQAEKMHKYKTNQESFWAGEFGNEYITRNEDTPRTRAGNLFYFSKILEKVSSLPESIIEFGANIGLNLRALKLLLPDAHLAAVEINESAVARMKRDRVGNEVFHASLLEFSSPRKYEMAIIKGVLIHVSPDSLSLVYQKLADVSSRYVLISEYYNRRPEAISYRGHHEKLFRRDFGGDFMETNKDFKLIDYGFSYHRDARENQDDLTWFLFERRHQ